MAAKSKSKSKGSKDNGYPNIGEEPIRIMPRPGSGKSKGKSGKTPKKSGKTSAKKR